jgi:hypothetical protein
MSNLFLKNKYTKTYYRIIKRAKSRTKPSEYTEKHHIIPKCKPFCGLIIKDNLVILTAREHYICHLLLLKMCKDPKGKAKMYHAFRMMGNSFNLGRSKNKNYEFFRKSFSKSISGENHPNFGKKTPHSEETKQNMRKPHSPRTPEHRLNLSISGKGKKKPHTKEHRQNLSNSLKGRIAWNKGLKTGPHKKKTLSDKI